MELYATNGVNCFVCDFYLNKVMKKSAICPKDKTVRMDSMPCKSPMKLWEKEEWQLAQQSWEVRYVPRSCRRQPQRWRTVSPSKLQRSSGLLKGSEVGLETRTNGSQYTKPFCDPLTLCSLGQLEKSKRTILWIIQAMRLGVQSPTGRYETESLPFHLFHPEGHKPRLFPRQEKGWVS